MLGIGMPGNMPARTFRTGPRRRLCRGSRSRAHRGVGVSPEVTAQMVANFLGSGAAVNTLADRAGASVRVVDMSVDGDTDPTVSAYKVRRSSG